MQRIYFKDIQYYIILLPRAQGSGRSFRTRLVIRNSLCPKSICPKLMRSRSRARQKNMFNSVLIDIDRSSIIGRFATIYIVLPAVSDNT